MKLLHLGPGKTASIAFGGQGDWVKIQALT